MPATSRSAVTIANVAQMVIRDRRWDGELCMNKEAIFHIHHEYVRNTKICAKLVPHTHGGAEKADILIMIRLHTGL